VESWFSQARRVVLDRSADSTLDTIVQRPAEGRASEVALAPGLELTLQLAGALLGYGLPVHRLEEALHRLAATLGFRASYFITPTSLTCTLSYEGESRTHVINVTPGEVDLERLGALHELIGRVERKEISPADASHRITVILGRRPRYGPIVRVVSFAMVAAAAAVLLGGEPLDLLVAAGLSAGVGLLSLASGRNATLGRVLPALATTVISLAAISLHRAGLHIQPPVLLLAGCMCLLPGLTTTIGMMELAMAHLVSGTARLMGAMVTFLQLGFGIALGYTLADALFVAPAPTPVHGMDDWAYVASPVVAAVGFSILLRVRPRELPWVLATCALAVAGSRGGGALFGAEVGAFVGAFTVGAASHLYARWKDRPALVTLVPGILMMVPGSIGFLGLSAMLEADAAEAVQTGFKVLMIATALSTGVLLATLAVPPQRSL
jgi:uncharacterized membrane protein YjjP (DUF1212 family)